MLPSPEALTLGIHVVDFLVEMPREIRRGDKHEVPGIGAQGGGPAATAACLLASLGHDAAFIAKLGEDPISALSRAEFKRHGVRTDQLLPAPGTRPAISLVEIDPDTGERTIFYNLDHYGWLQPDELPLDAIRQAKVVLIDDYDAVAARALLEAAREAGCRRVVDLESSPPETQRDLLALASDAILPMAVARRLSGHDTVGPILAELATTTSAQLVVTNGAEGCWALTPEGIHHQPAFPVPVVDTTGCGDVFHGGYVAAILRGMALAPSLEFASWCAAEIARGIGGRSTLPTPAAVTAALPDFSPALRGALDSTRS